MKHLSSDLQYLLKDYWGYDSFRPLQEEIISSVLANHETLALLPTGGGKSLCYQLPALALKGNCLVISPLIALMQDQVRDLNNRGIAAIAINSTMSYREVDIALDNAVYSKYKFIYVSPERLASDLLRERLPLMNVSLVAIDEAHCISQWGYDFRPPYLKIAEIKSLIPTTKFLALTATATSRVAEDICNKLEFKQPKIFKGSFDRKNLIYAVLHDEDRYGRLLKIIQKVKGSSLVYVSSRKLCVQLSKYLQDNDISSSYYHAGLETKERSKRQEDWVEGNKRVMVCTNAFGMGIDKADVRLVVHFNVPSSPEAYYQEAGRGGRDGYKSYAILLANEADNEKLKEQIEEKYPRRTEIDIVYQALGNYYQLPLGSGEEMPLPFDLNDFAGKFNLKPKTVLHSIKILADYSYLQLSESFLTQSRLMITAPREALYEFEVKNPHADIIIKAVLRLYGGAFEEYVSISEMTMAKKTSKPLKEVISILQNLKKAQMIDYVPSTGLPTLNFVNGRQASENLFIPWAKIIDRKKAQLTTAQAMMEYASIENKCRGKYLVSYFGENLEGNCGHCDFCLKPKEEDIEHYVNRITAKQNLSKEIIELSDLLEHVGKNSKSALDAIRWLVDRKQMRWVDDNRLEWVKEKE